MEEAKNPAASSPDIDLEIFSRLDYPPDHPLTLAREFLLIPSENPYESGALASVVTAWVKDQRPAFALKLILEGRERDRSYSFCTFARAAAASLEEPEPLLHALERRAGRQRLLGGVMASGTDDYDRCVYRTAVCEGYAAAQRLERAVAWWQRIGSPVHRQATVQRVAMVLCQSGREDLLERWAIASSSGPDGYSAWGAVVQGRLKKGELDAAIQLVEERLGGGRLASLDLISLIIRALLRANRPREAGAWLQAALARIPPPHEASAANGYIPFGIILASELMGKIETANRLWPRFVAHSEQMAGFMVGKGCAGIGLDHYAYAAADAFLAGLNQLADRVATAYQCFMQSSQSPPPSTAAAREELFARVGAQGHHEGGSPALEKLLGELTKPLQRLQVMIALVRQCDTEGDQARAQYWIREVIGALECVTDSANRSGVILGLANAGCVQREPALLDELLGKLDPAQRFAVRSLRLKRVAAWRAQNNEARADAEWADLVQSTKSLPEKERESGWIDLLQFCLNTENWDQAIGRLMDLTAMPNPLSGRRLVCHWAGRLCEAAGHSGVLSEMHLNQLRALLEQLRSEMAAAGSKGQ